MARTIVSNYASGLTLTSTGDSPITIGAGVSIANASGNALSGIPVYPWSIFNSGTIQAPAGDGVALAALGTLTNNTGGSISGYGFGVSIAGQGTLANQGKILGTETAALGFSYQSATKTLTIADAAVFLGSGSVTNSAAATIAGARGALGFGGPAAVYNAGTIGGTGTESFGIALTAGGGITNAARGFIYGHGYGVLDVSTAAGLTITNQAGAAIAGNDGVLAIGSAATIATQGYIGGFRGVDLLAGGSVSNTGAGFIYGVGYGVLIGGAAGSVTNTYQIVSVSTTVGAGIALTAGGQVTNQGTAAYLYSRLYGVRISGGTGTVTNTGTIFSSNGGQVYTPTYNSSGSVIAVGTTSGAAIALTAGGTITNAAGGLVQGRFIGVQSGLFPNTAAALTKAAGVTLLNSGEIDASAGASTGAAVWLHGDATVVNYAGGIIQAARGAVPGTTAGTVGIGPLTTIAAAPFGIVAYYNTTVINRGSIGGTFISLDAANNTAAVGNRVEIAPGATFASKVMGAASASLAGLGTLQFLSGASVGTLTGLGSKYVNFGNLTFDPGAAWSVSGTVAPGTTIAGFAQGDTLTLSGVTNVTSALIDAAGTLTIGGSVPESLSFGLTQPFNAATFGTLLDGNGNPIAPTVSCFAAGTLIRTSDGHVAVERLRPGMKAITARGEQAEIVWIGERTIDCRRHPHPETVRPVRVSANAFGPGLPSRDLLLSPDHAIFMEGVLIPIRCLIDGRAIRQIPAAEIAYFHVELPEHDVILAEDLPVESYLDAGDRANFSNGGGPVRLLPDFTARNWEMRGCAPLVLSGPIADRIRRRLRGSAPPPVTNRYTYY